MIDSEYIENLQPEQGSLKWLITQLLSITSDSL